jgi:hypothetical protein
MDFWDIVSELSKITPFGGFFEQHGLSKTQSEAISILLTALLTYGLVWIIKKLAIRIKNQKQSVKNLNPQFDYKSIKQASRYYIATQYQNASPTRQEEPSNTHLFVARNKLIPFFIKTAFNAKLDSERFYLILADSGMGKTTFMINLYLNYHSFRNHYRYSNLVLLRFSHPDTMRRVNEIPLDEARNTILLMDALDEDPAIISKDASISDEQAFRIRVDEIIKSCRNFKEVIITCRTQYFPHQEADPFELNLLKPDESGYYKLNKIYISPFTIEEVRKYLSKKFGYLNLWNEKKKNALAIVLKSKYLVTRPMLLNYIDFLLEEKLELKDISTIYKVLIQKWLEREAAKRKSSSDRIEFQKNLYSLSLNIATTLYMLSKEENRTYIRKEEAQKIASLNQIHLNPEEVTGQSLLTCDALGNWKFAHKSILEYFIADAARKNPVFFHSLNLSAYDMAQTFLKEKGTHFLYRLGFIYDDSEQRAKKYSYYIGQFLVDEPGFYFGCFLEKAMNFCNSLNEQNGYPKAYDEANNLLDADGYTTDSILKVKGFRIPTKDELTEFSDYLTGFVISKFAEGKSFFGNRYKIEPIDEAYSEWCTNIKERIITYSLADIRLKKPTNYSSETFKVEIARNTPIGFKTTERAKFRIVFIP